MFAMLWVKNIEMKMEEADQCAIDEGEDGSVKRCM